jgi:hypothetical protein
VAGVSNPCFVPEIRELLHTTKIVIEPIERFLEPWREGQAMAGFQQDLALVRRRPAQKAEKRLLTRFEGIQKVVSPIDH